jgi:alkanesulfonate monooxygenase SsuD/methylene tetrahydromethanopterin reductase-like flavin-dependent oxidoreductase (luciferase family)
VFFLGDTPWSESVANWQAAEELGFHHGWTFDHLSWDQLPEAPWRASVPTLAAAASLTSKIRLGLLVASPNFRHPLPFAQELVTLNEVARGRLIVGLGSGGRGTDATAIRSTSWGSQERFSRFEEFVGAIDQLVNKGTTEYSGKHYVAHNSHVRLQSTGRIDLAISAIERRTIALAAQLGSYWITPGGPAGRRVGHPEIVPALADQIRELDTACASLGRDPNSIGRIAVVGSRMSSAYSSISNLDDALRRLESIGFTDAIVPWPRQSVPFMMDRTAFVRFADRWIVGH